MQTKMGDKAKMMLAGMYSSFPQSSEVNPKAYLAMLAKACEGCSDEAVIEAAVDVGAGNVYGISKSFCPSTAEFGAHVRKIHERNELAANRLNRPKLEAPRRPADHRTGYEKWCDGLSKEDLQAHRNQVEKIVAEQKEKHGGIGLAPPAKQQEKAA